jgi:hypothetical protein
MSASKYLLEAARKIHAEMLIKHTLGGIMPPRIPEASSKVDTLSMLRPKKIVLTERKESDGMRPNKYKPSNSLLIQHPDITTKFFLKDSNGDWNPITIPEDIALHPAICFVIKTIDSLELALEDHAIDVQAHQITLRNQAKRLITTLKYQSEREPRY